VLFKGLFAVQSLVSRANTWPLKYADVWLAELPGSPTTLVLLPSLFTISSKSVLASAYHVSACLFSFDSVLSVWMKPFKTTLKHVLFIFTSPAMLLLFDRCQGSVEIFYQQFPKLVCVHAHCYLTWLIFSLIIFVSIKSIGHCITVHCYCIHYYM